VTRTAYEVWQGGNPIGAAHFADLENQSENLSRIGILRFLDTFVAMDISSAVPARKIPKPFRPCLP
jgi:hypothetical protein